MKKTHLNTVMAIAILGFASFGQAWAEVNSGSNGSDGVFNPTTNTVINMADHPNGIYQYTDVNIPVGVKVTFIPNANNTPVTWLVQGDCYINGIINVDGNYVTGPLGAIGGPGGFKGGNASLGQGVPAGAGLGPGGGEAGLLSQGGQASFGTVGDFATSYWCYGNNTHSVVAPSGAVYGNTQLVPLIGGSGGGGGSAGGGGGGGAILIAVNGEVKVSGSIVANGGDGSRSCQWTCLIGGGPGGSGGAIRLVATTISGTGTLSTSGGAGLIGWCDNYVMNSAGMGRIRLDGLNITYSGSTLGVTTRGFQPIIIPSTNQVATLTIASVAGAFISANPSGQLVTPDAIISGQQANPIPIVVNCSNLPLNTLITVIVKPASGSSVSAVGYNNTGTLASSTATVLLNMPRGGGIIYATAASGN